MVDAVRQVRSRTDSPAGVAFTQVAVNDLNWLFLLVTRAFRDFRWNLHRVRLSGTLKTSGTYLGGLQAHYGGQSSAFDALGRFGARPPVVRAPPRIRTSSALQMMGGVRNRSAYQADLAPISRLLGSATDLLYDYANGTITAAMVGRIIEVRRT